jgi:uncharacterized protein
MRKIAWLSSLGVAAAAGVAVAAAALPLPAHAQFFGDDWGGGGGGGYYGRGGYSNDFSFPFFRRPYSRPAESYRAPSPHKRDTQPASTVVVIGDSMADWLAYGLEEIYADNPQIGIVRNIRLNSGLIHYEPRNDTLEWWQAIKDVLATEKPSAIVVMLGLNDRVSLRVPQPGRVGAQRQGRRAAAPAGTEAAQPSQQGAGGTPAAPPAGQQPDGQQAIGGTQGPVPPGTYDFHTDEWAKLYRKRIESMISALKSKGIPVLWVGLPALRGTHATADMSYLDNLYHQAADKEGIAYVDIWGGFVDEDGRYTVEGPDFEGQIRRLRTGDGVHFTKYGALKLAHLVDQELSRVLANPVAPAALPSPQASAPAKPGSIRPAVGPVLPLTTPGGGNLMDGGQSGSLLGGAGSAAPLASEDPLAKGALVRGEALSPPTGRADDFAWQSPGAKANTPAPSAPAPAGIH